MATQPNDRLDHNREKSALGDNPSGFRDRLKSIPADSLSWLWLFVGFGLLLFTFYQSVVWLAAWLAPIFLLRFARTNRSRLTLPFIFLAYAVAVCFGLRGSDTSNPLAIILGLILPGLTQGLKYAIPYAADRWTRSRLAPWARVLVFPTAFTTIDWLMSLPRMINSTGSPVDSQFTNLVLLQVFSITGMYGLTFLMTWCASTVNGLWENHFHWRQVRTTLSVFITVFLAILVFGTIRLKSASPASPTVKVAAITLDGNLSDAVSSSIDASFNQSTDAQRAALRTTFEATVNQMLTRTAIALQAGAKIVTWQEGSGTVLEEDEPQVLERVGSMAKQYQAYLEVSLAILTRTPQKHFVLNQSILVGPTGSIMWTYDKTYPVFPLESYYTISGSGILPDASTPYGSLSTAICNDLHFERLIHQAGQAGTDILLAPYHDIHPYEIDDMVVATYRAIENGFSLVRPAGVGISTIVDDRGRTLASQDFNTLGNSHILMASLPTHGARTIYGRIGDLFVYLCAVGLVVLATWAVVRRQQSEAIVQHE